MSLYALINQCSTSMGSRRLLQWVKQPLLNYDVIQQRLNFVEAFYSDAVVREELRGSRLLRRIPDCDRLAKSITSRRATLEHCVTLYRCVSKLPDICAALERHNSEYNSILNQEFIAPLQELVGDFKQFCALIENTIDLTQAEDKHEYIIRPSYSAKLQQLHDDKKSAHEMMEQIRQDVAARLGLDENKVKLDTNNQFGWFLRVTRQHEALIRGKPEYLSLDTKKDGVRFRTSKLAKLSEKYNQLVETYSETQTQLVTKVIDIVVSYVPRLEDLSNILSDLDVYVNLAHVSATAGISYVRPTILPFDQDGDEGCIILKDSRHPCVEAQDTVNFIANDVQLTRNSEGGQARFHIITGPNMGGKSTYIRQVGVIVLMAQMGCFVPCSSATISITDSILARVGAGDSQLRGVSTFMAEMLETAAILRSATRNSLIIIDELGRGTSTYDGFGLAWAISKHICANSGAFCLFATHFHELTALAEHIPHVANSHVTAETTKDSLSLLYKVISFFFHSQAQIASTLCLLSSHTSLHARLSARLSMYLSTVLFTHLSTHLFPHLTFLNNQVKPGPCDQSFGIHVARLAQFPESVIQVASAKAAELENFETGGVHTSGVATSSTEDIYSEETANVFVEKFVELPLDTMSPADVVKSIRSLVSDIDTQRSKRQRIS